MRASARAKDAKKLTSAMTRHMIVHLWQKMEVARSARRARGRRRPTNKSRKLLETDQGDVWLTDRRIKAYDLQTRVVHRVSDDHIKNGGTVAFGDDEQCDIVGEGTAFIRKFVDGEWREARVENVPKLKKKTYSRSAYTKKDLEVRFKANFVTLVRGNKVVASGKARERHLADVFPSHENMQYERSERVDNESTYVTRALRAREQMCAA